MSAIASFTLLSSAALRGLRDAAVPRKRSWFQRPQDTFHDYLEKHGREIAVLQLSGWVLHTALDYLQERHQIDLMHSEHDELARYLSEERGASYFVLTPAQSVGYIQRLDPKDFGEDELRAYFNEFYEDDQPDAGKWMLECIRVLRDSLRQLEPDCVILLAIG
ncbi:MAG TPA: hypothetical protein VK689_03580 [Armatimonadota bacterium]|nr:hypothetical protein [Armatimonadota bacterium]